MRSTVIDATTRRAARIAGVWYADSRFFAAGHAAATAARILGVEQLYQLAIASFLAGQACQVFLGLALYRLFAPVDKDRARMLLALVIAMVPVAFLSAVGRIAPLVLLKSPAYQGAFEPGHLQGLAMSFVEMHKHVILVASIFWGLWLLPLGLLVLTSGFFPRILGVLLIVGCVGYVAESLVSLVFPAAPSIVSQVAGGLAAVGELPFVLWIVVLGARNPMRRMSAPRPAT